MLYDAFVRTIICWVNYLEKSKIQFKQIADINKCLSVKCLEY